LDLPIYGRNLEITDRTRKHVESKVDQIDRHLPGISGASVELAHEATRSNDDRIVAQVTLHVGGTLLRAQRRAANTTAAVNSVARALDQQIKRYKGHAYRSERSRQGGRAANQETEAPFANISGPDIGPADGLEAPDSGFANGQVVRVKEFDMEPMSVDEAAVQMQFLGHTFYMFWDRESDKHSVLYLRGDGNYGLIQPKSA
jgi:putative sigma-54 modulation protein